MKLIEPSCEYWEQRDVVTHIARCARVCYANEKNENSYEKDEALVKRLIESGHISMLRHGTVYYIIPLSLLRDTFDIIGQTINIFINTFSKSPYLHKVYDSKYIYLSTNKQFIKKPLKEICRSFYRIIY